MKIELTVGSNKYIGENKKDEDVIANVDFEGHFMIQVDLRDMTFTGMGMDGHGYPLSEGFYDDVKIREIV